MNTKPQMQGIYPTEPIPPYMQQPPQPMPQTINPQPPMQPQPQQPQQSNQRMIPANIAAYEVYKWLLKAQITAALGIAGSFIVALVSVFHKVGGAASAVVVSCALMFFLYQVRQELVRLKTGYNLR